MHVYGGLELSAYDTNSPFAHAGLTSDAGEYLADTAKNWSLGLTPVGSGSSRVVPVLRVRLRRSGG